jgi:predicted oxidoreductase
MNTNNILTKKSKATRIYSQTFQKLVINEYKKGFLSVEKLTRKYGLKNSGVILSWIQNDPEFMIPIHTSSNYPFQVQ